MLAKQDSMACLCYIFVRPLGNRITLQMSNVRAWNWQWCWFCYSCAVCARVMLIRTWFTCLEDESVLFRSPTVTIKSRPECSEFVWSGFSSDILLCYRWIAIISGWNSASQSYDDNRHVHCHVHTGGIRLTEFASKKGHMSRSIALWGRLAARVG